MTSDEIRESSWKFASDWVYGLHVWRGRSSEFMQSQVDRLAGKLMVFAESLTPASAPALIINPSDPMPSPDREYYDDAGFKRLKSESITFNTSAATILGTSCESAAKYAALATMPNRPRPDAEEMAQRIAQRFMQRFHAHETAEYSYEETEKDLERIVEEELAR